MKFFVFSDDDLYHDPVGFTAMLSLFNLATEYVIAPGPVDPRSDHTISSAMDLITPICWRRGECLGVDPNCHVLRRKRFVGQELDTSVPYTEAARTILNVTAATMVVSAAWRSYLPGRRISRRANSGARILIFGMRACFSL